MFPSDEENGGYGKQTTQRESSMFRKKEARFMLCEVSNAGESGLLYYMAPDTTVATAAVPISK